MTPYQVKYKYGIEFKSASRSLRQSHNFWIPQKIYFLSFN